MVLHARVREQEDNLWQLLYMLKGRVQPSQRIHLHCFMGDRETVDLWVMEFPNVCFGYTSLIASCSEAAKEALLALDLSRLLLETYAPFFKAKGAKLGSPLHLGTMANAMARYRSESWQEILQLACSNGKRLYAPPHSRAWRCLFSSWVRGGERIMVVQRLS
ncbi:putative deoxyribonuclease TATDN2 [Mya arenaria]|uniref:putative deoxyribonuclease TATDN2 n=1 Tax=Mya arenaria TaxID=6604 RepID=UPI0022E74627|nr:putative deoxyribonuclease TATDN2 [Mya arenaria]